MSEDVVCLTKEEVKILLEIIYEDPTILKENEKLLIKKLKASIKEGG